MTRNPRTGLRGDILFSFLPSERCQEEEFLGSRKSALQACGGSAPPAKEDAGRRGMEMTIRLDWEVADNLSYNMDEFALWFETVVISRTDYS